ncbi:MAG: STAS domain-containing protein [Proteobacteria bacterium]|nr:STAS domain-containing protein [Pseudomonadota bacterium]
MSGRILVASHEGIYVIKFVGDVRVTLCVAVEGFLDRMFRDQNFQSVLVDLSETQGIDSTSLGLLAKLSIQTVKRFGYLPTLISTSPDITRILLSMGFEDVFNIVTTPLRSAEQLGELPISTNLDEGVVRSKVIEAHQLLMNMNENNRLIFKDLVKDLQAEADADSRITRMTKRA